MILTAAVAALRFAVQLVGRRLAGIGTVRHVMGRHTSPSCIVTAVPSISVISPVIVWPEQSDVLLPHAASDSVSAAAQKRERIFLLFIKNGLLRHCVSQMLPRGCRFSLSPWNEVMIARQPKKAKGKFEHFVFHENAKSSAA